MPGKESKPPITSKKAKRAYQKSSKQFTYSASQFRAAERRTELEERAQRLRDKEQRAKDNKRKRDEKEDRELEAKRRLVAEGKVTEQDLLPKIRASQARLNTFFRKPAPPTNDLPVTRVTEETFGHSSQEGSLVDNMAKEMPTPPKLGEEDLIRFFSTAPSIKEDDATVLEHQVELPPQKPQVEMPQEILQYAPPSSEDDQGLLDAQLLSGSDWNFEIAEDETAQYLLPHTVKSSPFKRKLDEMEFGSPSKSARSALSEMSPSKVNMRAQEKPDTTSTPPSFIKLPSPLREHISSKEAAQEALAMISTQDLADDEFVDRKENTDPHNVVDQPKQNLDHTKEAPPTGTSSNNPSSRNGIRRRPSLNSSDFSDCDDLFDGMGDENEFGDDLDDDAFAGLLTQMPAKNTAVSAFGSPKKIRASPHRQPRDSKSNLMAPPALLSRFSKKIEEAKEATKSRTSSGLPKSTQSFPYDADMEAELLDMVELADAAEVASTVSARQPRVLPWQRRSAQPNSQSSQEHMTSDLEDLGD